MTTATVYLTSGSTWTVPANFASLVSAEAIGGGGTGADGNPGANGGGGGGGGEYRKITSATNIAAGNSLSIQIGSALNTFLKDNTNTVILQANAGGSAAAVSATGGSGGSGGTGAAANFAGGPGGNGNTAATLAGGGGGGGAAGPTGSGKGGGNSTSKFGGGGGGSNGGSSTGGAASGATAGGAGGNNTAGSGGGVGGLAAANPGNGTVGGGGGGDGGLGNGGGTGSMDTSVWDGAHGPAGGSGGGDGTLNSSAGTPVAYGAGGGGGSSSAGSNGFGAAGSAGIIVIVYNVAAGVAGAFTDFANPRRTAINPAIFAVAGSALALLSPVAPFGSGDWPVPRGAAAAAVLRTHTDGARMILAGRDAMVPGQQTDPTPWRAPGQPWSNKTHLNPANVWLIGKDNLPISCVDGLNYDWPAPRGATPGISLRTHTDATRLQLIGLDAMAPGAQLDEPPWRAPGHAWSNKSHLDPSKPWLAGLDNIPPTLGEQGAQHRFTYRPYAGLFYEPGPGVSAALIYGVFPFPAFDWPNPRGYVPGASLKTHTDATRLQLIGLDAMAPGQATDFNPFRPALPSWSVKTHIDVARPWLWGADNLPAAAMGGLSWENPVPRGYAYPVSNRGHIDQTRLGLFFIFPQAFNQTDWPVPRGYPIPISNRTHTDPTKAWLAGLDAMAPGQQTDGNPWRAYAQPWSNKTHHAPTPIWMYFPAPFAQTDWPVPKGSVPGVSLKTHTSPAAVWLIGLDNLPPGDDAGLSYDWPNPRGWPYPTTNRVYANPANVWLIGLDALPVGGRTDFNPWLAAPQAIANKSHIDTIRFGLFYPTPFGSGDWPVPRGAVPAAALRTHTDPSRVWLIGLDAMAPGQATDPNPWRAPAQAWSNKTHTDPARPWLWGLDNLPPSRNADQAAPRGYAFPTDLRGQALTAPWWFYGAAPFVQTDWPVPRGAAGLLALRSHIDPSRPWLAPLMPMLAFDYPNPRPAALPIALRTHTDATRLQLIGKDRMFGAPGEVPAYDWQLPIRAGRLLPEVAPLGSPVWIRFYTVVRIVITGQAIFPSSRH